MTKLQEKCSNSIPKHESILLYDLNIHTHKITNSQESIISPIGEILTITAITIGIPIEISRLYFGFSGNLREQVRLMAWIIYSLLKIRRLSEVTVST